MEFKNLENEIDKVNEQLADEIQKLSPKATGRLARSIKAKNPIETPKGITAPIELVGYYVFPNFGTKFQKAQKFVDRGQEIILNKEINDIAEAAAEDVVDSLEEVLPSNINLTIQL